MMSRRTPNRPPQWALNPGASERVVQWNGGILPITYEDVSKINEQRNANQKQGVGPSFADRIIAWNNGVPPLTHEEVVAISQQVRTEFKRGLAPGPAHAVVEGGRRTQGVSAQPVSSKKPTPRLRRITRRIGQDAADKGSTPTMQTPEKDLEDKYPLSCPPHDPGPSAPSKPEPWKPSRQPIPRPVSPSMRAGPICFCGSVVLVICLHDESPDSCTKDEFDAATDHTGASSSILHAFREFGVEDEAEFEREGVWDPLEETDQMIIALREAEGKEAVARNREERIREAVRQRRERQEMGSR